MFSFANILRINESRSLRFAIQSKDLTCAPLSNHKYLYPQFPVVSWSTPESYSFCFEGLPQKSVLALGTNGCISGEINKYYFRKGYYEMLSRLNPTKVIIYGRKPMEFKQNNILFIESYSQTMKKRIK